MKAAGAEGIWELNCSKQQAQHDWPRSSAAQHLPDAAEDASCGAQQHSPGTDGQKRRCNPLARSGWTESSTECTY